MKFTIDPKIFEKFPGVAIGVLVITDMDNRGHNGEILKLLREEERLQKEKLTGVEMGALPEVAIWRKIYKNFGSNPSDFRSSVEALLRRARGGGNLPAGRQGEPLPQINNLVDIYNYISLRYHLPVGAEDLDKIAGDIILGFAKGTEKGIYLGSNRQEMCYEGEVVYKDDKGFICRRWNWREADRTKIDFETKNAVLVIESAPGMDAANLESALTETAALISKYLSGKIQKFILDHTNYHIDIDFQTGKKTKELAQTEGRQKKAREKIAQPKSTIPKLMDDSCLEDKNLVSFLLRKIILEVLNDIFGSKLKVAFEDIKIEHPKIENYGDYATNIAMRLARQLKMKPQDTAKNITEKINEYIIKDKTIILSADSKDSKSNKISISEILENIDTETIGVGFINFKIKPHFLISLAFQLLENKNIVRLTQKKQTSVPPSPKWLRRPSKTTVCKKIVIEHTSPNIIKMLHVGHLRNNFLGMSVGKILKSLGFGVVWDAINNDRGIHICKAMWAYLRWGIRNQAFVPSSGRGELGIRNNNKETNWRDLLSKWVVSPDDWLTPKNKNTKPDHFVDQYYILGVKEEEKEGVHEQMQEMLIEWEKDSPSVRKLWKVMTDWVHEGFKETYKRIGSLHNKNWYESKLYQEGKELVRQGLKKGAFRKLPDGAILTDLSNYGLPDGVAIRKDGTALYFTFDPNLTKHKRETFAADLYIWDIGPEQALYLKQLFAVCEKLGIGRREDYFHLSYGFVYLAGKGKMSSREGTVVSADDLLDIMHKKAREIMEKSKLELRGDMTFAEKEKIAEMVGVGALKYGILKVSRLQDIYFDIGKSVSFEGDSGPYLMYTYARCKSVMRKAGLLAFSLKLPLDFARGKPKSLREINEEELALLRTLYRFPEVVIEAARNFSPNLICGFLYDLAQKYNLFYQKHSILNLGTRRNSTSAPRSGASAFGSTESVFGQTKSADKQGLAMPARLDSAKQVGMQGTSAFRLFLTEATAAVIKRGLDLLGIETVERM